MLLASIWRSSSASKAARRSSEAESERVRRRRGRGMEALRSVSDVNDAGSRVYNRLHSRKYKRSAAGFKAKNMKPAADSAQSLGRLGPPPPAPAVAHGQDSNSCQQTDSGRFRNHCDAHSF